MDWNSIRDPSIRITGIRGLSDKQAKCTRKECTSKGRCGTSTEKVAGKRWRRCRGEVEEWWRSGGGVEF